jgi:hypothetical protein
VTELIDTCAARVRNAVPRGAGVLAGLCCTHYGYVSGRISASLERALGRRVRALDPNARMVSEIDVDSDAGLGTASRSEARPGMRPGARPDGPLDGSLDGPLDVRLEAHSAVRVEVISKVELDETARHGVARLIEPVSPTTARALLSYSHVPSLF